MIIYSRDLDQIIKKLQELQQRQLFLKLLELHFSQVQLQIVQYSYCSTARNCIVLENIFSRLELLLLLLF